MPQADESRTPHERFGAIHQEHPELVARFIDGCHGGSLAWAPLMKLQEDLCMEQLRAREELFRDDLRSGKALPQTSEQLRDKSALAALLGARPVPRWLV